MQNMKRYNVLAPGPVNLHPKVIAALSLPMIHHRTPEFDRILNRTLTKLQSIFQTKQPCFALTATGTGGMEALFVTCFSVGDEVLIVNSGKFGERWVALAQVFGAQVHELTVPWGQAVDPKAISEILSKNPNIRAFATQATETSTGVAHPLKEISAVLKNHPSVLFLVDGITALGAYPLPMDELGIDGLVGGSQKAFMLPTGLTLLSLSDKAWERAEKSDVPKYYFDLRKEKAANKNGETFFSSNVTLIRALDVALDLMLENGLDQHFQEIHHRAEFTRLQAANLGLSLFSQSPSNTLTVYKLPERVDGQKLRLHIETDFNITLMGGQDQAKGKILRIGHMGYIQPHEQLELMLAIYDSLKVFAPEHSLPDKVSYFQTLREDIQRFWPSPWDRSST
jgi:aspartate aminotransferase-like enzyme